ncbi:MAG: hydantoinase B/oxoprolinase family protein, partial [Akkermansiaceae bacterium]|nr:hydantoinase B/oxoprolinase family protein [Akkermansiaceae bacterium]
MSESQRDFLDSILRAMRPALMRPLASQALIDVKQIACGLLDRQGRLLATDHLGRAGTLHATSACILDYFGHELESGDVVMTNDPYSGGTRIQDLTLLTPIQSKGRNVGYAMAVCPLPDLGGNALGGNDPRALEIWAEGIRVT